MNNNYLKLLCAGVLVSGLSNAAQATLMDRGGGMIYDSDQNITWLQDTNYALTSGYATVNTNGKMDWDAANTWVASLTVGGYSDWRLPTVGPIDGVAFNYTHSNIGDTDFGYNISAPGSVYEGSMSSELAYMYYNILGNLSYYDTSGNPQAGYGLTSTSADGVSFLNMQSGHYWSGTEYAPSTSNAWLFRTTFGEQDRNPKSSSLYSWAVRSGDVAAIPIPGTVWMFVLALASLGVFSRTRNKYQIS